MCFKVVNFLRNFGYVQHRFQVAGSIKKSCQIPQGNIFRLQCSKSKHAFDFKTFIFKNFIFPNLTKNLILTQFQELPNLFSGRFNNSFAFLQILFTFGTLYETSKVVHFFISLFFSGPKAKCHQPDQCQRNRHYRHVPDVSNVSTAITRYRNSLSNHYTSKTRSIVAFIIKAHGCAIQRFDRYIFINQW